ncbi:MAG: efflux RND transporter permease subunit [Magnetococcales bacterium]|nr:efflux RND transporter permease subunit [Magnetococcales bacterium]
MLRWLLNNHVFANLTFGLVLILGAFAYTLLPRQQDPDMNFNWINVITALPGASAADVEKLVTDPLEAALEKIQDVRFVISTSREGRSSILLRFQEIDTRTFDKRMNDLRREVRNKQREMPAEVEDPLIFEITSANGFPAAMVVVTGLDGGENLRRQARQVRRDLERLAGVSTVDPLGLADPEIQIRFYPERLVSLGLDPPSVADTLASRFRDVSGGTVRLGDRSWSLRLEGIESDPEALAQWPVVGPTGEIALGQIAEVIRGRKKADTLVHMAGKPGVLLPVTRQPGTNILDLTRRINEYVAARNKMTQATGVTLHLADDQTHLVQRTLQVMESNAVLGLVLVIVTSWIFLGSRLALLVGLGVPFSLAGFFGLTYMFGGTINVMLLLGVVIALGMLVDDAVVIVEAIFDRLQRGVSTLNACQEAIREVAAPVLASVLTTQAAFLPLMLLPGILGMFMRVIPLAVATTLAISLVEAFWMMPTHVVALDVGNASPSRIHHWRLRMLRQLRHLYGIALVKVLRWPRFFMFLTILPMLVALGLLFSKQIRVDFFAMDPMPLFYVNLKMPPGTPLEETLATLQSVEKRVQEGLRPGEARSLVIYAGQMFTETEPLFGDRYGQVLVSLVPGPEDRRQVKAIVEGMRTQVMATPGPAEIGFMILSGGPPVTKPIDIKVRGENDDQIRPAVAALKKILEGMPEVRDIADNHVAGQAELVLRPDGDAVRRAGLSPAGVLRLPRLLGDGEVVAHLQEAGEKVEVRVMARPGLLTRVEDMLRIQVTLPGGGAIPLGELMTHEVRHGVDTIHHHNFRRTIAVQAELDKEKLDIVAANDRIRQEWERVQDQFPGVNLDFTGIMDDIEESLDYIKILFLFGLGLIYMILGTQFRSYWQPFMIVTTIPVAFTGVIFGLLFSGHPLSLYSLYGVVALSGIAVNSAIVLISAANDRRQAGMGVVHAIVHASRRRLVPILITTMTTIAGLFSLAVGMGGQSLLWGPVATAIVWGLGFSTLLTLFMIPLLYSLFMRSWRFTKS